MRRADGNELYQLQSCEKNMKSCFPVLTLSDKAIDVIKDIPKNIYFYVSHSKTKLISLSNSKRRSQIMVNYEWATKIKLNHSRRAQKTYKNVNFASN